MFRIVYTLLILAWGLSVVTAASLKHANDVGKVRQVVSLLNGVSKKLATEREKENVVYDELRRRCEANGPNLGTNTKPQVATGSENVIPNLAATPTQLEDGDDASVDQLSDVVKAAVQTADQHEEPDKSETVLENVSSDTAAMEQGPDRSASAPPNVDPEIKAVHSEFDAAATQVANLEKDLTPGQVSENAAVSEAVSNLQVDGAIPNIDQQALALYNSFGGEPATLETLGSLGSSQAFLQVAKQRHHRRHRKLAPALQADVDAALQALKAVAEDTKNAMSMLDVLRDSDSADTDSTEAASDSSSIEDQCASLMKSFELRRNGRAKQEAELQQRSQKLLEALPGSRDSTAKNLRSQE